MNDSPFEIKPYGPGAIVLEWAPGVEPETLSDVIGFSAYLSSRHLSSKIWEQVPIYHTLTLICRDGEADVNRVAEKLPEWYREYPKKREYKATLWELPVCYEETFGIDLAETAQTLNMDVDTLISQHTAQPFRVYGIGFLPGFLYLGGIPDALKLPRREHPRLRVPKGSVGLAGSQTGIYPQTSPGGWHIIGNCPVPIFNPEKEPPCLVAPGDLIQFRAVSQAEYELHKIEGEVGIYKYKKGKSHA
jgi:inhibitor of KinA